MALNVPVYNPSIPVQAPGEPNAEIRPMGPDASGLNINEAAAKVGMSAEQLGGAISRNLVYKERIDAQTHAYDVSSQYARAGMEKSADWLNREGANAKGITQEFQKWDTDTKAALLKGESPYAAKQITRSIDSHGNQILERLINHEAQQHKIAGDQSRQSASQAATDISSLATTPEDLRAGIEKAAAPLREILSERGIADENSVANLNKSTADHVMGKWLAANIERDPKSAETMLNSMKGDLSDAGFKDMQANVDGKLLEARSQGVWDHVSQFKHGDGTQDVLRAENKTKQLTKNLPPHQQQHILEYVKSQATMADSALRDMREAQSRQFFNDAADFKKKGIPFEQAAQELFKKKGYGFDAKDVNDKTDALKKLYTNDESFYSFAQKHETPEQSNAWKYVEKLATSQVPKSDVPAFLLTERKKYMGKSADEITVGVQEDLKKVDLPGGHFWNMKVPGWKVTADVNAANAEKMGALEKTYAPARVSMAKAYLESQGKDTSPDSIAKFLALTSK